MAQPFPLLATPMRISVPYNHAADFAAQVIEPYADLIDEVYLPVHTVYGHTGRPWSGPIAIEDYHRQIDELDAACRPHGIALNFVANATVDPIRAPLLAEEIAHLHRTFAGSRFTLGTFELAVWLHQQDPTLDLQPSTAAHIAEAHAAWYWKHMAGARWITMHRAANKRLDQIRAIRRLGLSIRVVVNDKCLPDCPSEAAHGTQIRLYDELRYAWADPGGFKGYVGCRQHIYQLKNSHFWLVAIKDILPGHLPYLVGLVDLVKISGRSSPTQAIARTIERYAAMESLENDGPFYREPPEAWNRITTCDRACEACGWCEKHLEPLPHLTEYPRSC